MTDQINVSEVSAILRKELEGISTDAKLEEVGTVLQVSDGVARIYGLDNAEASELLRFDNGMEAIVMNLEVDNVGAVLLGPTDQIEEGDTVRRTASTRWAIRLTEKEKSLARRARCRSSVKHRVLSTVSL